MSSKSLLIVLLGIIFQLTQVYCLPLIQKRHNSSRLQTSLVEFGKNSPSPHLYVFGGFDENEKNSDTASGLDVAAGKWTSLNSMPSVRGRFCGAVVDKQIFLFGGYRDESGRNERQASADVYNCLADTYKLLRPMPYAISECGAAALKDSVYVAGGMLSNGTHVSSFLRYDIRTNQWTTLRSMNTPRYGHTLVELGGLLYAIGGYDNSVEVYNPATDHWSFVANTHYYHHLVSSAVIDGKIYVLSSDRFEVYSPRTNQWAILNVPTDNHYYGRSLVSMNGELWASGGSCSNVGKSTITKKVHTYDPSTGQWTKQRDMNIARQFHSGFAVNH